MLIFPIFHKKLNAYLKNYSRVQGGSTGKRGDTAEREMNSLLDYNDFATFSNSIQLIVSHFKSLQNEIRNLMFIRT